MIFRIFTVHISLQEIFKLFCSFSEHQIPFDRQSTRVQPSTYRLQPSVGKFFHLDLVETCWGRPKWRSHPHSPHPLGLSAASGTMFIKIIFNYTSSNYLILERVTQN